MHLAGDKELMGNASLEGSRGQELPVAEGKRRRKDKSKSKRKHPRKDPATDEDQHQKRKKRRRSSSSSDEGEAAKYARQAPRSLHGRVCSSMQQGSDE